jgi:Tfp pilus assembly protein PilN
MNRPAVTHINLLERKTPTLSLGAVLAAVLALTVLGLLVHGRQTVSAAWQASARNEALGQQIKDVQAKLTVISDEKAKNAQSVALRQEVEALQPRARAAQTLLSAVRNAEGGRGDDFARALAAATAVNEPGLWLTNLSLSAAGKRLELQGQAAGGAPVLRFARRANDSLQSLTLRLDSLDMQPATVVAAPSAGGTPLASSGVSFRLY